MLREPRWKLLYSLEPSASSYSVKDFSKIPRNNIIHWIEITILENALLKQNIKQGKMKCQKSILELKQAAHPTR